MIFVIHFKHKKILLTTLKDMFLAKNDYLQAAFGCRLLNANFLELCGL